MYVIYPLIDNFAIGFLMAYTRLSTNDLTNSFLLIRILILWLIVLKPNRQSVKYASVIWIRVDLALFYTYNRDSENNSHQVNTVWDSELVSVDILVTLAVYASPKRQYHPGQLMITGRHSHLGPNSHHCHFVWGFERAPGAVVV